jgi:hypothetical protein
LQPFSPPVRYPPNRAWARTSLERNVFSCDYNGWADVPEEEREGLDAFEAARMPPARALLPARLLIQRSILPPFPVLRRRAA